jgi:hypothetical protein
MSAIKGEGNDVQRANNSRTPRSGTENLRFDEKTLKAKGLRGEIQNSGSYMRGFIDIPNQFRRWP